MTESKLIWVINAQKTPWEDVYAGQGGMRRYCNRVEGAPMGLTGNPSEVLASAGYVGIYRREGDPGFHSAPAFADLGVKALTDPQTPAGSRPAQNPTAPASHLRL